MVCYNIQKERGNQDFDRYILTFGTNSNKCYYYETYQNKFVNEVEVIFDNYQNIKLEENKIYVFFNENNNYNDIRSILEILNQEFSSLTFKITIFTAKENAKMKKMADSLELNYTIINGSDVKEYNKRLNNANNNQFYGYKEEDNPFIKTDAEDVGQEKELQEDYANYNGYNERLIDNNVKNIVSFKHNKKNNNSE